MDPLTTHAHNWNIIIVVMNADQLLIFKGSKGEVGYNSNFFHKNCIKEFIWPPEKNLI